MNRRNAISNFEDLRYYNTKRPSSIETVASSSSGRSSAPRWDPDTSYFNRSPKSPTQPHITSCPIPTSFFSPSSTSPKSPRTHSLTRPCTYHDPLPTSPSHYNLRASQLTNSPPQPQSNSSTAPTAPAPITSHSNSHSTSTSAANFDSNNNSNEAASKLAEALDDFLGDVERKFKGISEEILARLDEMAERCDRLESELSRKETSSKKDGVGSTV